MQGVRELGRWSRWEVGEAGRGEMGREEVGRGERGKVVGG